MEPYATLAELVQRIDRSLDDDDTRVALGALADASDLARSCGRDWDSTSVPRLVRTPVLKACKRYVANPNGYTQSRAGDETVGWNDGVGENAGTVYFTADEQKLLSGLVDQGAAGQVQEDVLQAAAPYQHARRV